MCCFCARPGAALFQDAGFSEILILIFRQSRYVGTSMILRGVFCAHKKGWLVGLLATLAEQERLNEDQTRACACSSSSGLGWVFGTSSKYE